MRELLISILLFIPLLSFGQEVKVVSVTDGDTVKVLTLDNQIIKVRLAEIDTPERKQHYGKEAKMALSALVFGKTVDLRPVTIDRYGRTVGHLFVGSLNVNKQMVRTGHAWVYKRYMKDKTLITDEDYGKFQKVGIWPLPEHLRIAPWVWRKRIK
jgi:endonuclease YncB( thermonuclease family)